MTYKGRVDWWIVAAMVLAAAVLVFAHNYWIGVPVVVVLLLCGLPQRYITTPGGLEVRAGLIRRSIPYDAITFVGPSTGGRSLALSLDGVKIQYGLGAEVRISPADTDGFLADMAERTPHLLRCGQNLVVGFRERRAARSVA